MQEDLKTRNQEVEVLRAFAILLVLGHHLVAWFPNHGPEFLRTDMAFWGGVDLFFAISGWVISRSLLPQLHSARNAHESWQVIKRFWVRRAFRILPSAWLWLVLVLVLSIFFNRSGYFGDPAGNRNDLIAGVFQFANFHFASCGNGTPWFEKGCGINYFYWSLSLEEQFYLLLPVLALLMRRKLAFFLVLVVTVQFFLPRVPAAGAWFLWAVRSDALALGVLLAISLDSHLYRKMQPRFLDQNRALAGVLVLGLLAALVMLPADGGLLPVSTGLMAVSSAALVWLASYQNDYVMPAGAVRRGLQWVGTRSYGIYLVHNPAYAVVRETASMLNPLLVSQSPEWATALFISTFLLLTGALAELNYRFVEMPLREAGRRIAARLA